MNKFLTKENIIICVVVFYTIIQSNYFATKLDLANVKLEMAQLKNELKDYSDTQDKEILKDLDNKYQMILTKLDKLK
ncbi:MAG: hypothetical protein NC191_04790 [Muribaculaceae bacterium]|nr:hypothetical protein [Muribaculaceae bacterium]